MRTFLAGRVGSGAIANALELVSHRADRAIGEDPINREVASSVIGRIEILARGVDVDVRRKLTVRRGCVEESQRSGRRVDGIGAHAPSGIFVDGVEMRLRGVKLNERWFLSRNDLQGSKT